MSESGRSVTLRLPSAWTAIGVVAVGAVIAGAVVAGVRTHDLSSKNDRLEHSLSSFEQSALATGRQYALQFATYRYDSFAADVAKTEAHSVDPFLSQYRSLTAADGQLQPGIVKLKSTSSAKLISAGIASISQTSAVLDVFFDQTIVNTKGSTTYAQRITMTMVRPHDRWLISRVQIFD